MNRRTLGTIALISGLLLPISAWADEVLERVVVRNRLYNVAGRLELTPSVGVSIVDKLTSHYTFGASASFNLFESLALDARATYALSRHTGLANRISAKFLNRDPSLGLQRVDDLSDLWEMNWTLMAGVRWAPIYGKLSFLSELPIHYQTYLWVGGGMGGLHRESVVYCLEVASREEGTCRDWLTDDRVSPVGSAALGMRFFTSKNGSLKLELRDYVFADQYRVDIDRLVAEAGDRNSGTPSETVGLTHVFIFEVGYAFTF